MNTLFWLCEHAYESVKQRFPILGRFEDMAGGNRVAATMTALIFSTIPALVAFFIVVGLVHLFS